MLIALSGLMAVLFAFYVHQIRFAGRIEVRGSQNFTITNISPLQRSHTYKPGEIPLQGYYNSIEIELPHSDDELQVWFVYGDSAYVVGGEKNENILKITQAVQSPKTRFGAFFYYNRFVLTKLFLLLALLVLAIRFRTILLPYVKSKAKATAGAVRALAHLVASHRWRSILCLVSTAAIYPALLLMGINMADLYNASHGFMFATISTVFLVPVFVLFFLHKLRINGFAFFGLWAVVLIQYFVVSPYAFAGNFGFHGFFHSFIIEASQNSFFNALIVPDAGYLAIVARLIYELADFLQPDLSQIIAITSFITLLLYAFLLSQLLHKRMMFLWVSPVQGFVVVVLIACFPLFSPVPGLIFPLPATDVAYYGVIVALAGLFIVRHVSRITLLLYALLVSALILSKAHMVMLFPVFAAALGLFIKTRNKHGIFYTGVALLATIIQALYCYLSVGAFNSDMLGSASSFSIQIFSLPELVGFTAIYFVKSYVYLLLPFAGEYINSPVLLLATTGFIVWLSVYCIGAAIKRNNMTLPALWFLACNITALATAFFYGFTFSPQSVVEYHSFGEFAALAEINPMRYTIGVHSCLAFSVIPLLCLMIHNAFAAKSTVYARTAASVFLILLVSGTLFFRQACHMYPEFWRETRGDLWSREWKELTVLLREKEFYIPIVFYPEYKEYMKTPGLETAIDFLPHNSVSIQLPDELPVHSIIVLNKSCVEPNEMVHRVELYHQHKPSAQINALYKPLKGFRFGVFIGSNTPMADSIVFIGVHGKPLPIDTHVRIISPVEK